MSCSPSKNRWRRPETFESHLKVHQEVLGVEEVGFDGGLAQILSHLADVEGSIRRHKAATYRNRSKAADMWTTRQLNEELLTAFLPTSFLGVRAGLIATMTPAPPTKMAGFGRSENH